MKNKYLILILLIFLFSCSFLGVVQAQPTTDNQTNGSSSVIEVKPASSIFKNIKNVISDGWQKIIGPNRGEVIVKIKAWFSQRKEAIKVGWSEEKQEFQGGFKQIFSNIWQKIKNLISGLFHNRGD